jgi:hypothetical protein
MLYAQENFFYLAPLGNRICWQIDFVDRQNGDRKRPEIPHHKVCQLTAKSDREVELILEGSATSGRFQNNRQ